MIDCKNLEIDFDSVKVNKKETLLKIKEIEEELEKEIENSLKKEGYHICG